MWKIKNMIKKINRKIVLWVWWMIVSSIMLPLLSHAGSLSENRDNSTYPDSTFRDDSPSNQDIFDAYYGNGAGDTIFTEHRNTGASCPSGSMSYVEVSPWTNTIPLTLNTNTIYILDGQYDINDSSTPPSSNQVGVPGNYYITMSDCSAIIARGSSTITLQGSQTAAFLINASDAENVIVDDITLASSTSIGASRSFINIGTPYGENKTLSRLQINDFSDMFMNGHYTIFKDSVINGRIRWLAQAYWWVTISTDSWYIENIISQWSAGTMVVIGNNNTVDTIHAIPWRGTYPVPVAFGIDGDFNVATNISVRWLHVSGDSNPSCKNGIALDGLYNRIDLFSVQNCVFGVTIHANGIYANNVLNNGIIAHNQFGIEYRHNSASGWSQGYVLNNMYIYNNDIWLGINAGNGPLTDADVIINNSFVFNNEYAFSWGTNSGTLNIDIHGELQTRANGNLTWLNGITLNAVPWSLTWFATWNIAPQNTIMSCALIFMPTSNYETNEDCDARGIVNDTWSVATGDDIYYSPSSLPKLENQIIFNTNTNRYTLSDIIGNPELRIGGVTPTSCFTVNANKTLSFVTLPEFCVEDFRIMFDKKVWWLFQDDDDGTLDTDEIYKVSIPYKNTTASLQQQDIAVLWNRNATELPAYGSGQLDIFIKTFENVDTEIQLWIDPFGYY